MTSSKFLKHIFYDFISSIKFKETTFKSRINFYLEKACGLVLFCWLYAIAWNIPPFVGWGRYIPEGILDSCSFDYLTRDTAVTQLKL